MYCPGILNISRAPDDYSLLSCFRIMHFLRLALLGAAGITLAHPGAHEPSSFTDLTKRNFLHNARDTLNQCADQLEARGIKARAEARRAALFDKYKKRSLGLEARDTDKVVNTSHQSNLQVTQQISEEDLFAKDPVCILAPEGEIGPFWVKGELVRYDIGDGEEGVPVYLEGQFIDINTCEPIKDLYWDVWNCNSTGVYSGVQSSMNGNGNDDSNLDKTFLRGIQKTDADGVAGFKTVFPGHYSGRATHVHVVAHLGATQLANNTLTGGYVPHIGQLFFDQDLINEIEATYPYNTNTVAITENANDHVVIVETEDSDSDPFFQYALLGDTIEDGLVAWVTLGVNVSASHDSSVSYAATLTSSGGVSNDNAAGGGGQPPSGSGAPPA
ncbi:Intradiol ring-cleavage dioxygenase [Aspergillus karnatakaensis]|uniref:intradiol ring-cleavage dioxygenase n=1 Tax=Aspergillus karnatakaensis TaxID=1810916 RepID=UPI003CCDD4B2